VRVTSRATELIRQEGVWRTFRRALAQLHWKYVVYRDDTSFDRKYGTDTSRVETEYLKAVQSDYLAFARFYEATKWRHFAKMMAAIPIDRRDFTFIDAGCGKGRVLIFAGLLDFKRIVGVEFSAELCAIATENIARFRRRKRTRSAIDVQCEDIARFELPDDNLLIYLYNPFRGELMELFIERIRRFVEKSAFQVYIAYRNPQCGDMFEAQPFLETLVSNRAHSIYRAKRPRAL
jgi:SAM-dependent methyltransferase